MFFPPSANFVHSTDTPSVLQITFMKLLGTAIASAMVAVSGMAGKSTTWSLAICAAVNFIACAHYWWICK